MRFLEKTFRVLSTPLLPTECIACKAFQAHSICANCLVTIHCNSLMQYECCYQCGLPLNTTELSEHHCRQCKLQAPYFDETICLDRYQGILQDALHQFKYQKRLSYASGLADVWNHLLSTSLISTDAHYLMPVPLSVKKLHARGFNQSWELARKLRCNANLVKLPYALKRHHHSECQVGSSRDERYRSIQEMFYIDKEYRECL